MSFHISYRISFFLNVSKFAFFKCIFNKKNSREKILLSKIRVVYRTKIRVVYRCSYKISLSIPQSNFQKIWYLINCDSHEVCVIISNWWINCIPKMLFKNQFSEFLILKFPCWLHSLSYTCTTKLRLLCENSSLKEHARKW